MVFVRFCLSAVWWTNRLLRIKKQNKLNDACSCQVTASTFMYVRQHLKWHYCVILLQDFPKTLYYAFAEFGKQKLINFKIPYQSMVFHLNSSTALKWFPHPPRNLNPRDKCQVWQIYIAHSCPKQTDPSIELLYQLAAGVKYYYKWFKHSDKRQKLHKTHFYCNTNTLNTTGDKKHESLARALHDVDVLVWREMHITGHLSHK